LFAKFCDSKFCVGVSNGLDAIKLSLQSLGIGPGDEVILPAHTYIATCLAIINVGATPVFVDIDNKTYNIDCSKVEKAITKNTKAIIAVHMHGLLCDMNELCRIKKKYNLFLIEDSAQAHGALQNKKVAGSFSDVAAFSFYPTKNLGCYGDGGAVVTNNEDISNKIKMLRNYGAKEKYVHLVKGNNYRLDELQAAFLTKKIKNVTQENVIRNKFAELYFKNLSDLEDIILPYVPDGYTHVWHTFSIRLREEVRKQLISFLNENNVQTAIHYPVAAHQHKAFENEEFFLNRFENAEKLCKETLSLPLTAYHKEDEILFVIKKIRQFFKYD